MIDSNEIPVRACSIKLLMVVIKLLLVLSSRLERNNSAKNSDNFF